MKPHRKHEEVIVIIILAFVLSHLEQNHFIIVIASSGMKSTINLNNFRHWSDFKSRAEVSDYITSIRFSFFLTDSENMLFFYTQKRLQITCSYFLTYEKRLTIL